MLPPPALGPKNWGPCPRGPGARARGRVSMRVMAFYEKVIKVKADVAAFLS
jgi:hypothetical protein